MPETTFTLNGHPTTVSYEPGMDFLEVLREECQSRVPQERLRAGRRLRLLRGFSGRPTGARVFAQTGTHGRARRGDSGRHTGGDAPRVGRSVPAGRRGAVRLLHSRYRVRASGLLQHGHTHDREAVAKSLDAHLCRCTGYARIVDAIQTAGEAWENSGTELPSERASPSFVLWRRVWFHPHHQERAQGQWNRPVALALSRTRTGAGRKAFRRRHARARNAARRAVAEPAPAREGSGD